MMCVYYCTKTMEHKKEGLDYMKRNPPLVNTGSSFSRLFRPLVEEKKKRQVQCFLSLDGMYVY